jgi:F-type H+-transporting ATPase subunit b
MILIQTAYAAEEESHTTAVETTQAQSGEHTETTEHASTGVAGKLGLDATYFVGQLITFGIVLFILWKWVFTPVAQKLTERTEKIEKAMSDADRITKEKQEFEMWKNEQMSGARKEAAAIVTEAQSEANKAKDQTLLITKRDQEKIVAQAKAQIEQEKNQALASAKSELADLVTSAAEKILKQKLDNKKDQELIKESLKGI